MFQSPSLRGSGRFKNHLESQDLRRVGFNPLHCGAVVASAAKAGADLAEARVSIPFIAGQWSLRDPAMHGVAVRVKFQSPSLRGSGRFRPTMISPTRRRPTSFNPLHCGAVVAS